MIPKSVYIIDGFEIVTTKAFYYPWLLIEYTDARQNAWVTVKDETGWGRIYDFKDVFISKKNATAELKKRVKDEIECCKLRIANENNTITFLNKLK